MRMVVGGELFRSSWASGEDGTGTRSSGRWAGRGKATWDDAYDGRMFPPNGDDAYSSGAYAETAEGDSRVKAVTKRDYQQQQLQK